MRARWLSLPYLINASEKKKETWSSVYYPGNRAIGDAVKQQITDEIDEWTTIPGHVET